MNKPLLLVILFCLSVLVILSPVIYVTVVCGEWQDIDVVLQQQREADGECLVGMSYGEANTGYMKIENAKYYQPEILAVGASRIMQMKGMYFNTTFYNSGTSRQNFDIDSYFIESLNSSSMPKIVILDLNQFNFNDNYEAIQFGTSKRNYGFFDAFTLTIDNLWSDLMSGTLLKSVSNIINNDNKGIGYDAKTSHNGFMKDGSHYYGNTYMNPNATLALIHDQTKMVKSGTGWFTHGDNISTQSVDDLNRLLKLCKDNGIYVIGCLPPYSPTILEMLDEYKESYAYLSKVYPTCKQLFDKYGYELYDYTDMQGHGIDDTYFVDGFHGGEVAYLKMVIDMVNQKSVLNNYTNVEYLNALYDNRASNLTIYPCM